MTNIKAITKFIEYYLGLCSGDEVKKEIHSENQELFLEWAKTNLMLSSAYELVGDKSNCDLVDHEHPLGYTPKMIYHRYMIRRNLIVEKLKFISNISKEKQIPILHVKGTVLERYYPNRQYRFTGDVDIVLEDINQLWPFVAGAFNNGYEHMTLPTVRRNSDGNISGLVKVECEHIASKSEYFGAEFNVNGFTITDLTQISWKDLYEDSIDVEISEGIRVKIPSVPIQIILIIAENVTRDTIALRDLLDLLLLFTHTTKNDLVHIELLIKKYGLANECARLLQFTRRYDINFDKLGVSPDILAFIEKYQSSPFLEEKRLRIYKGHILPFMKYHKWDSESISQVLHFSRRDRLGNKLDEDEKLYTQRLEKLSSCFSSPREQFEAGHHVYFQYMGDNLKGDWEWLEQDGFQYVRTPVGVYWVSSEGIEPEEIFEQALKRVEMLQECS